MGKKIFVATSEGEIDLSQEIKNTVIPIDNLVTKTELENKIAIINNDMNDIDNQCFSHAISIAKTNFKIDSHLLATRNDVTKLVIDTLNDTLAIDTPKTTGLVFDNTNKSFKSGVNALSNPSFESDLTSWSIAYNNQGQSTVTSPTGQVTDGSKSLRLYMANSATFTNVEVSQKIPKIDLTGLVDMDIKIGSVPNTYGRLMVIVKFLNNSDTVLHTKYYELYNKGYTPYDAINLNGQFNNTYSKLSRNIKIDFPSQWNDVNVAKIQLCVYGATEQNNTAEFFIDNVQLWKAGLSTIVWTPIATTTTPVKAWITADTVINSGTIDYYISRDNGVTFTKCILDTLVDISNQPSGQSLVLKVVINGDVELKAIAFGWK